MRTGVVASRRGAGLWSAYNKEWRRRRRLADPPTTLRITRRNFLGCAAALTALPLRAQAAKPQRVAVIGAGLAGLVTGFELMQAGHSVSVFEAQARPGGRVRTRRDAFGDGMYVEEGAAVFGEGSTHVRAYLEQFGLRVRPASYAPAPLGARLFYIGGKRYPAAPGREPDWPYALSPQERRLGIEGVWDHYVGPRTGELAEPFGTHGLGRAARALDEHTLEDLARRAGATDAAILLLERGAFGADLEHVSALQDVLWRRFLAKNHSWSQLEGGNDQLPQAFAARLGARLHLRAQLRSISQDRSGVRLGIAHDSGSEEVVVERVVLALPFSVLRQMPLGDTFSKHKRAAIEELRYESATRVYLHSRARFWAQAGSDGAVNTDLPIGAVRDVSAGQSGAGGILATDASGAGSRRLAALPAEQRLHVALEGVTQVFPELQANFTGAAAVCWDEEPYARGAWAYYAPGR